MFCLTEHENGTNELQMETCDFVHYDVISVADRDLKTILVVDDERDILNIVEAALNREGYAVIQALDGDQALDLFQKLAAPVDLLLTDVVMPGMSGPMLVDRLLAMQPSLPVLFMSGYDDRQIVQRYVLKEGFALLPKPFSLEALCQKVTELLPSAPANNRPQNA
jgi:two-component system cell cycle sensor histidine kinase/response regulator CckA